MQGQSVEDGRQEKEKHQSEHNVAQGFRQCEVGNAGGDLLVDLQRVEQAKSCHAQHFGDDPGDQDQHDGAQKAARIDEDVAEQSFDWINQHGQVEQFQQGHQDKQQNQIIHDCRQEVADARRPVCRATAEFADIDVKINSGQQRMGEAFH